MEKGGILPPFPIGPFDVAAGWYGRAVSSALMRAGDSRELNRSTGYV